MEKNPLQKWEFYSQPCEFYRRSIANPVPGGSAETGLATGVGGRCLWAVRNSAWEKTYAPNGFTTQDVWHGELSNISLKSSMFRNIVSNHGFYSFFFQVKCFQSPFCCSFCNQQVPFHEMDFLSLNNQDFILNCPRAVIPPHFFCFVAGCPYDSPDLRAW